MPQRMFAQLVSCMSVKILGTFFLDYLSGVNTCIS